jgi:hypothetical protein
MGERISLDKPLTYWQRRDLETTPYGRAAIRIHVTYSLRHEVRYPFPVFEDSSVLFPSDSAKLWRAVLSMKGQAQE